MNTGTDSMITLDRQSQSRLQGGARAGAAPATVARLRRAGGTRAGDEGKSFADLSDFFGLLPSTLDPRPSTLLLALL
jgi:hypothetical protein